MMETVALPVWLVVAAGIIVVLAVLDRLLVPSVRWFLRSRTNKVLDEVSKRLQVEIRPFQQSGRQALIDRLVYDDGVQEAAREFAATEGVPREVAMQSVARYAREIVPAFNAYIYFRVGYWIGRTVSRSLYRIRVGFTDDQGLASVPPNATVVFVMNHRSNMDYIIASYLASERAALSYAVGEWARIWPLQQLIRSMGAYFVRRNSRDPLYRRVLERYVSMATEAGVTQAVYPEGGLSRDGRLREPKLGVVDYMLRGFAPDGPRDLVFIPVALNYDRTLEDRTLLASADPSAVRPSGLRAAGTALAFLIKQVGLAMRKRWHRHGYACVNFGTPVSMKTYVAAQAIDFRTLGKDDRQREVARLGKHLMDRVGRLVPVLPVPLVAMAFIRAGDRALSSLELKASIAQLVRTLEAEGAHVYVPRQDWDYAVGVGLRMLVMRRLVTEQQGLFVATAAEMPLLSYYANSIVHLLPEAETVAPDPAGPLPAVAT